MILVNGSKGIGTGFSTDIMCYDPLNIIDYLSVSISNASISNASISNASISNASISSDGEKKVNKDIAILPYYEGFRGDIKVLSDTKYLIKGKYEIINDKQVRITELPIGTWTDDYKQFIEELIEGDETGKKSDTTKSDTTKSDTTKSDTTKSDTTKNKKAQGHSGSIIKDYIDMSTDLMINITVTFTSAGIIQELVNKETEFGCNGLEKLLKLYTTKTNTNMHVFNEQEKLVKYSTIYDLINDFIKVRYAYYVKRKAYQIEELKKETLVLTNKARFITAILDDTLDLRRKKTAVISELLKEQKYDIINNDNDFKYLVRLPMDSVSEENVQKIIKEKETQLDHLNKLQLTSEYTIWLNELANLRKEYLVYRSNKADAINSMNEPPKPTTKNKPVKTSKSSKPINKGKN
jgi:DNA topoisomerase-2